MPALSSWLRSPLHSWVERGQRHKSYQSPVWQIHESVFTCSPTHLVSLAILTAVLPVGSGICANLLCILASPVPPTWPSPRLFPQSPTPTQWQPVALHSSMAGCLDYHVVLQIFLPNKLLTHGSWNRYYSDVVCTRLTPSRDDCIMEHYGRRGSESQATCWSI